jgi:hypothetical protein
MKVEELLQNDFARLINILYRLDVDEEKIKMQINDMRGASVAQLISKLIIERQLEKLQAKWRPGSRENIPDEEKW